MKIPFGTISISERSKGLIADILRTNRVSSGKYVREFEARIARLLGVREAVAVSSGTDADALALAVLYDLGAKRYDEVIVPALSFAATGNAVLQAGFIPRFVDIDRRTLNIDPDKIESAINERTIAILPVHLMGKPADMDRIIQIARRHRLYVIEDAAEAWGAVYKGKNAGTLGDMGAFSLYVAHLITTVEGGIVVTQRQEFADILRSLRAHGRACKCSSCVLNISSSYCKNRFSKGDGADRRFIFERIGYSSKMNEFEAAIGLGNLDEYEGILKKRRENLLSLIDRFKEFEPWMVSIEQEDGELIGPHAFPIIIKEGMGFTRDMFVDHLERHGIDSRHLFSSMPTQCPGFARLGYKLGDFPEAEYIGRNGLHIGVHQDIGPKHIDYFIQVCRDFVEELKGSMVAVGSYG
jgi:dTDP-4-amino-4,6-dideoxygalactose transaminase